MTNDNSNLRAAILATVTQALRDQEMATGYDEPWNAPAPEDVTTDIMALVNATRPEASGIIKDYADHDNEDEWINYTSESETAAILADPDTMAAIAEAQNEVPSSMTVSYPTETEHWFTVAWYGTTHMITIHDDHGTNTEIHARKVDADQRLASLCATGYKLRPTT
jgi:hypothetical protein